MAESTWYDRLGLTPVKGGVIALLSIVLLVVLAIQFSGDSSPDRQVTPSDRRGAAQRPARSKLVRGETTDPAKTVSDTVAHEPRTPWPRIPLEQVLAHDPLKLPEFLRAHAEESVPAEDASGKPTATASHAAHQRAMRRQELLQALQRQGVSVIVSGTYGASAMMGTRCVQVGDEIDGFVITEIRPDGLILSDPEIPGSGGRPRATESGTNSAPEGGHVTDGAGTER